LKKHPFFNNKSPIDWKAVYDAKLLMPKINLRPVFKSSLPFSYKGEESEDEGDYYNRQGAGN
jgi:hypothetical protein